MQSRLCSKFFWDVYLKLKFRFDISELFPSGLPNFKSSVLNPLISTISGFSLLLTSNLIKHEKSFLRFYDTS